jgi:hypothetical protein
LFYFKKINKKIAPTKNDGRKGINPKLIIVEKGKE